MRLELISSDSDGWGGWRIVKTGPRERGVGTIAFAGPPSEHGEVRLSWEAPAGYAAEAIGALIDWAFEDERTRAIVSHTEARSASAKILEQNGLSLEKREANQLIYALRRPA
jgi:RimJ/RimL family protein N-acetyltransferase